jgi:putative hydrolase of the HAD superfamily
LGLFIFFDVGGTLLHFRPSFAGALGRSLRALGHPITDEASAAAFGRARAAAGEGPDAANLTRNRAWWHEFYAAYAREAGCLAYEAVEEVLWRQHVAGDWLEPAADARATLERLLGAGHRLGVISNWDDTLEGILDRRRLLDLFEVVTVSTALGAAKPDGRIFRAALDEARVAPSLAVHVGDEPVADGEGARAAGIRPVLIGGEVAGVDRIETLSELWDLPGIAR